MTSPPSRPRPVSAQRAAFAAASCLQEGANCSKSAVAPVGYLKRVDCPRGGIENSAAHRSRSPTRCSPTSAGAGASTATPPPPGRGERTCGAVPSLGDRTARAPMGDAGTGGAPGCMEDIGTFAEYRERLHKGSGVIGRGSPNRAGLSKLMRGKCSSRSESSLFSLAVRRGPPTVVGVANGAPGAVDAPEHNDRSQSMWR
mmetsp:Transcript_7654/g.21926  ORF Transcript_7654/g.21926 Transcript_7654/m.21926 type:complete len:200 (+) Transcript_7654:419-1018(+)